VFIFFVLNTRSLHLLKPEFPFLPAVSKHLEFFFNLNSIQTPVFKDFFRATPTSVFVALSLYSLLVRSTQWWGPPSGEFNGIVLFPVYQLEQLRLSAV